MLGSLIKGAIDITTDVVDKVADEVGLDLTDELDDVNGIAKTAVDIHEVVDGASVVSNLLGKS